MTKRITNVLTILVFFTTACASYVLLAQFIDIPYRPRPVNSVLAGAYTLTYLFCLWHLYTSGRVREFRFGWAISLFIYGIVLFPVYWYKKVRSFHAVT